MRKPCAVTLLKTPISLQLGRYVGFGDCMIVAKNGANYFIPFKVLGTSAKIANGH